MTALAFAPNGVRKPSLSNVIEEWFGNDSLRRGMITNPSTNIIENDDSYVIELSVPGHTKESFEVNVERNQLRISTSKSFGDSTETDSYKMREFSQMAFSKSFHISDDINVDNISAQCKNGILSVILPKRDEAKPQPPRSIKIDE